MLTYQFIDSPFGDLALLWMEQGTTPPVIRILIPLPGQSVTERLQSYPDAVAGHQPQIDDLCAQIARYLSGERIELPIDLLDRAVCTPFHWKALIAVRSIPRGEVQTYRQLAVAVGNLRGARAVGNAMAKNPFPIVLPCHRAIRSDGSLGGYLGGIQMKRRLLEMEGVTFDARGRVLGNGWDTG